MNLRQKMKRGPVFGFAIFTGASCVIESVGNWGYDFVYLDVEHTSIGVGPELERQIMAARLAGISSVVRLTGTNEVDIRKTLEMGAEGVVIPHVRTKEEAAEIVRAAKFPPVGRRGAESNVRAAAFGGPGFSWEEYIRRSNEESLIIPMAEDYEFADNVDDILSIDGIDAINFGPIDYSLSANLPIGYKIDHPSLIDAYKKIETRARAKGVGMMCPVVPPTIENAMDMIAKGVNMLILGNDMYHLQTAFKTIMTDCVEQIRQRQ
ncbi:HpcH/HpaI aldolase family protein [Propionivibrio dicarboxylicus]|uniref:4-hydroxy-2-oxoheptanedioate aldolase n=1 Tax=Propionivibrio dicarboxylicus TaxID=83767 RepID=A0A1G8EXV2_9RHOO|nr:aldolase/citrate lyase family protein [Propionivibrio dicarboxylicus]SDH74712.1 4-hydroxy-2-oxoheptanedioate aldolase [Propionivibrio dicarboxylicus]